MKSHIFRSLMVLEEQPESPMECFELVGCFVATVREPTNPKLVSDLGALITAPDQAARLGYLLDAMANMAPLELHATWAEVLRHVISDRGAPGARWVLFGCDPGVNELDELARRWGLYRGLAMPKLRHIVRAVPG